MLDELKHEVCEANLEVQRRGLVIYTWGNVSAIDRGRGIFGIKPSGVSYEDLRPETIVLVDLEGRVVEGRFRPSTDTESHRVLYRAFPDVGGIVHTHSPWATVFAQACIPIPCYGTTHADHFYGEVPVTEPLAPEAIRGHYERETGESIVRAFARLDPIAVPGILAANHGPFAWGKSAAMAVYNAVVLEEVARMAFATRMLAPDLPPIRRELLDRHYLRKHGRDAYYGQT
ncbi:MAG: L-ribulose-5-phosphate 4-epimerase [Planctomycetes bacterium]|nr:L-ribulose-5-phosphate 4-epimerase [Planctomycetota bacterium]